MDPHLLTHILDISQGLFAHLTPVHRGATGRAFFSPGEEAVGCLPSTEVRRVCAPMPLALRSFYTKYPSDVEFVGVGEWTFLCEEEIAKRHEAMTTEGQPRLVDLAVRYAGMGHVDTCAYDPVTDTVFHTLDGGSNGWDREANHQSKVTLDVDAVTERMPFETWWQNNVAQTSN